MKKIAFQIYFLVFLSLNFGKTAAAQSPYIPLNHRVYSFIERMSAKKSLEISAPGTLPISRKKAADFLLKIQKKDKKNDLLSRVERNELQYLIFKFQDEIPDFRKGWFSRIDKAKSWRVFSGWLPAMIYANGRNLFSYDDGQFYFAFDPIFRYRTLRSDSDSSETALRKSHFTNGVRAYGRLNKYVAFFFDFRDNKEWGTQKYRLGNYTLPQLGFVRATSPDYIYHDETEAYLRAGNEKFQVTFGKFKNIWGRGKSGSLILSDYATSYDQLKFEFRHKKFYFTSVYAYLIDYQELKQDTLQGRKFLAGHRLEINPVHWLSLGLSETVIFKGRNFEPAYLNPVMFLRSAEHYLGSPDNMMMSADFRLLPVNHMALYGEILLDDLTTTKLGTDWYGNKYGYLVGIFFAKLPLISNCDFRAEYVRIRPFVYSHEGSVNYSHYASALGHPAGPNSDLLWMRTNFYPTFRLKISAEAQYRRHGQNTSTHNVGGDIEQFWTEEAGFQTRFLAGDRTDRFDFALKTEYEMLPGVFFKAAVVFSQTREEPEQGIGYTFSSTSFWASMGMNF